MCGCRRPNERFGGSGYRRVFCKECRKRPDFKQRRILEELEAYLFQQSNISKKNIKRIRELLNSDDHKIREMAQVVDDIAQIKPKRRKRIGYLKHNHPQLFERFSKVVGLVTWEPESEDEWEEDLPEIATPASGYPAFRGLPRPPLDELANGEFSEAVFEDIPF